MRLEDNYKLLAAVMHTLGRRIKAIRSASGLTQMEYSRRLRVAQSTVSRWETDDDDPSDEFLRSILDDANSNRYNSFGWNTIADLRYGLRPKNEESHDLYLFDRKVLADLGKGLSSYSPMEMREFAAGKVDIGLEGRVVIAMKIDDDSMKKYAPKGSMVLIDLGDTKLDDGSIGLFVNYLANGQREALLRILRTEGPIRLEPTDPSKGADTIFLQEDPTILGRAVSVIVDLPNRAV